jgi:hypothetical protein
MGKTCEDLRTGLRKVGRKVSGTPVRKRKTCDELRDSLRKLRRRGKGCSRAHRAEDGCGQRPPRSRALHCRRVQGRRRGKGGRRFTGERIALDCIGSLSEIIAMFRDSSFLSTYPAWPRQWLTRAKASRSRLAGRQTRSPWRVARVATRAEARRYRFAASRPRRDLLWIKLAPGGPPILSPGILFSRLRSGCRRGGAGPRSRASRWCTRRFHSPSRTAWALVCAAGSRSWSGITTSARQRCARIQV